MFKYEELRCYLAIVLVSVLIIFINNYLSLILDLLRPKLSWKDENEAVKQNFNVFLGMIISLLISALFIGVGVLLLKRSTNIYLIFTILYVVLLITLVAINVIVKKNENKLFSKVG